MKTSFIEGGDIHIIKEITTDFGGVISSREMKFHTILTYDGVSVTATVKDYLGNVDTAFNAPIEFILSDSDPATADSSTTVTAVNGVATVGFTSTVAGTYTMRTNIANIRNGEVTINV
jgi:hypothetical protein